MPSTRRRNAPAAASAVVESDQAQGSGLLLHFNEPLSWKAGKAIPISDLLSRLQKLAKELRNLDPEGEVDPKDVFKIAQELASPNLLAHKDRGIRAWTMCCVVDLLRICVPHAPFRSHQLKDIFTTFVNYVLPQLADSSSAYNAQHLYVLKSLAEVHSIALITDLDRPEQLILSLMTSAFDIVSGSAKTSVGEEVTTAVEAYLTQILVQVIDASSAIPAEVTDVIIVQFLRVDPRTKESHSGKKKDTGKPDGSQSDLLQKSYPRAYEMAKAICVSVPEKMMVSIGQYFSNVIVDASEASQANGHAGKGRHRRGSLGDAEDEVKDVKELGKAHRLIRELWRACPDVLLHVIPQIETELSAESSSLRLTATETLSDVASGIGIAGYPSPGHVDPAAYPPQTLSSPVPKALQANMLQIPMSPKPFAQVHVSAYEGFLSRKQDKSSSVRSAWATGAGRILLTSAGGIGLAEGEEEKLNAGLAQLLADVDEKVRLAAIKAVGSFAFIDVIRKLGSHGSISSSGSVLATLSDRIRDRKSPIRDEAMHVLGRMWAAAAGEIERGNEEVIAILGEAPSKLLDAYYVNDPEIHALLDHVMFEYLVPLNYPPIKTKHLRSDSSQKRSEKQRSDRQTHEEDGTDADLIRVRRLLTLLHGLDERAKKVFFGMQNRQTQFSRVMSQYLRACEEYNGGVVDKNENEVQKDLKKWVEAISKTLPEPTRVAADLWKFAKLHDRRNYQLIRFCLNAESEYRTVVKAIKELSKRLQASQTNSPSLDTMTPLLYRCSLLVYNRSHVPSILRISREDERGGLAETAHELLKEMSSRTPEVLKTHVQELCRDLESTAPSDSKPEEPLAADMLKACAEFARKFPMEIPGDRKFLVALTSYALFSRSPRAAKHAVSIIMVAGAEKKEMYGQELMAKATKDCNYRNRHFLTRLATISQVTLLDPKAADQESETIIRITTQETLLKNHPLPPFSSSSSPSPSSKKNPDSYSWSPTPGPEAVAKEWSLKCLVNFLRSHLDDESFLETATPIYAMLTKLIEQEGEVSVTRDTPSTQRPYLRLTAAHFLLKLCSQRRACEDLVTPALFNKVALVMHDRLPEVRAGFCQRLKKLLAADRLNHRWYTVMFLLAFEPEKQLKQGTMSWLRSRTQALSRRQQQQAPTTGKTRGSGQQNTIELLLARLLSLLSHHPDFPDQTSSSSTPETFASELFDFAHYILFYLQSVANDENLSLIFHVAQRVKQTQDAVPGTTEDSERLYVLSDLAQATIRHFADLRSHHHHKGGGGSGKDVNLLQTWPGKLKLPLSLFKALLSHEAAQEIADRNYLPEEVAERLEGLVKAVTRPARTSAPSKQNGKKRKVGPSKGKDEDEREHGDADYANKVKKSRKASASSSSLQTRESTKRAMRPDKTKTPRSTKKRKADSSVIGDQDSDDGMRSSSQAPARKSLRRSSGAHTTNYAEGDSEEDDEEMERWQKAAAKDRGTATDAEKRQKATGAIPSGSESGGTGDNDGGGNVHRDDTNGLNYSNSSDHHVEEMEDASDDDSSSRQASPTPLRHPVKTVSAPASKSKSKSKSQSQSQSPSHSRLSHRTNNNTTTTTTEKPPPATPTNLLQQTKSRLRTRARKAEVPAQEDGEDLDPDPDLTTAAGTRGKNDDRTSTGPEAKKEAKTKVTKKNNKNKKKR